MEPSTIDPSEVTRVTLSGKSYGLRFTGGSVIRLRKNGLDLDQLREQALSGSMAVERIVTLLQASCAELSGFTVEQVGDMVPLNRMKEISEAINEAIKKVLPPEKAGEIPTPPAIQ
jgi:hypothetical protein